MLNVFSFSRDEKHIWPTQLRVPGTSARHPHHASRRHARSHRRRVRKRGDHHRDLPFNRRLPSTFGMPVHVVSRTVILAISSQPRRIVSPRPSPRIGFINNAEGFACLDINTSNAVSRSRGLAVSRSVSRVAGVK